MVQSPRRRSSESRIGARAVVVGLALAMVGLLAIQTSSIVRGAVNASRTTMDGASASASGASSGFVRWIQGIGGSAADKKRIAELEAEVANLHRWKDAAQSMVHRMEVYERLLDVLGEPERNEVTARVVAESDGPFEATVIAAAGAAQGVEEGYYAVNQNGLVGRVIRVGERTSRILLLSDFASRIPVRGLESDDRAMLVGDRRGGVARLIEAESPDRIVEGEIWVTSGDDGRLPESLIVGRARFAGGEWRVDLALKETAIDYVRLRAPPDYPTPEEAPAPGDAAAGGVVATPGNAPGGG